MLVDLRSWPLLVQRRSAIHWANNRTWDHGPQNKLSFAEFEKARAALPTLEKGVICGTMAKWLVVELRRHKFQANVVSLSGGGEKHLCHAVVEVGIGQQWALLDPYFNCSFSATGKERLSALDIRARLSRRENVIVQFDGCSLNWLMAWKAWQKSLQWLTESVAAAKDVQLSDADQQFFAYLLPWTQTGSPNTKEYGWRLRQYSYWRYFDAVPKGGH